MFGARVPSSVTSIIRMRRAATLIGGQAHQHPIGMAGQGAGDTADFRERVPR